MKTLLVSVAVSLFYCISSNAFAQGASDGGGVPHNHYQMHFGVDGEPLFNPSVSGNEPQVLKDYWDSLFYKSTGYDSLIDRGLITTFATDGDNLYVGGSFQYFDGIQCYNIIRYNRTTGIWSTMDSGFSATVEVLKMHNGKLYAGGRFNSIGFNGTTHLYGLAVWNSTTNKWEQVGNGVNNTIHAIEFMDSSIIVGGDFTYADQTAVSYIARWNGHQWDNMNGGVTDRVYSLLVTGDSLYVGGRFYNHTTLISEIALYTNGGWQALGNGLDGTVYALAKYNGQLWVGGDFTTTALDDKELYGLARWDGNNWLAFGNGADTGTRGQIFSLNVVGDSIYIGGGFKSIAGVDGEGILKWSNGKFSPVGKGVYGEVHATALFNGSLYVGGTFLTAGSLSVNNIAKVAAGDIWKASETSVGAIGGYSETYINAVVSNANYTFIGGNFSTIRKSPFNHVAAWDKQNRKWISLGKGVDGEVISLAVLGSNVYVGGGLYYAGDTAAEHIAYWDMTSHTWHSMGEGSTRFPASIAANETGVYASIYFPFIPVTGVRNYLGRWDGTQWHKIDGAINGFIDAIAAKGTSLFIGGTFNTIDNIKYTRIAGYDGSSWYPLGAGLNNEVRSIAVVGSDVYAAGYFTNAGTLPVNYIARWDGNNWNDMKVGLNSYAYALAWNGTSLYVGGDFTQTLSGVSTRFLAQWDGNNWNSVSNGVGSDVYGLAVDNQGLYVGGAFSHVNNVSLNSYRFGILHFGSAGVSGSIDKSPTVQNFPNPFTEETTISYTLAHDGLVTIEIYDLLGLKVKTVVNEFKAAGEYELVANMKDLPSGTYLCKFTEGGVTQTKAISLVK